MSDKLYERFIEKITYRSGDKQTGISHYTCETKKIRCKCSCVFGDNNRLIKQHEKSKHHKDYLESVEQEYDFTFKVDRTGRPSNFSNAILSTVTIPKSK
jgi:hypothetical protein